MDAPTIAELQRHYAAGGTVVEVVGRLLDRLRERGDDGIWIDRVPDAELLDRAARLDALAEHHQAGPGVLPLFGIPCAVKGNVDVAGLPTTAGCPSFGHLPAVDAEVVRRLRGLGAVVVGSTTLDQFATGLVGTRSPYGVPVNQVRADLVPGGSSSGSAVAVAAGLVPVAIGTDTAGSGRVPAALNGILGLKPTRGLLSTRGVVPACRSLDCVSVFARTVQDARTVLGLLAGPDPADPWSRTAPPAGAGRSAARPGRSTGRDLAELRVAWPAFDSLDFEGDRAMRTAHRRLRETVETRCAAVVEVPAGPLLEAGRLLYGPWVAERWAVLEDALAADDVLPVTRAVVERGAAVTAAEFLRARYRVAELAAEVAGWWRRADLLLLPTVPTTFTLEQVAAEPFAHNATLGRYTQFTNLLDLACVAFPAGRTPDGRPVGASVHGPAFSDDLLLDVAATLLGEPPPGPPERDGGPVLVAVAGRHLTGESRNGELVGMGARLVETTLTAAEYRLLALSPADDPLPALVRTPGGGGKVEVELWAVPRGAVADLLAAVPAPLALGRLALADGRVVTGFVGDASAAGDPHAVDLTDTGGWRYRPLRRPTHEEEP